MDDGGLKSYQSKGVLLHTHCFSIREIELLCEVLYNKWQLKCWPKISQNGNQIYISGYSYEILSKLILPFLIPSMYYKLKQF